MSHPAVVTVTVTFVDQRTPDQVDGAGKDYNRRMELKGFANEVVRRAEDLAGGRVNLEVITAKSGTWIIPPEEWDDEGPAAVDAVLVEADAVSALKEIAHGNPDCYTASDLRTIARAALRKGGQ